MQSQVPQKLGSAHNQHTKSFKITQGRAPLTDRQSVGQVISRKNSECLPLPTTDIPWKRFSEPTLRSKVLKS